MSFGSSWRLNIPRLRLLGLKLLLAGFVFAALAAALFAAGQYRATQYGGLPLALWLAGITIYLTGSFLADPPSQTEHAMAERRARRREIWLLGLVVSIAFGVRVAGLTSIPNGCQVDEAINGLLGEDFLRGSPYVPFVATYQRPTLYPYMAGLTLRALGHGVPQVRVTSVLLGTLTVAAFFFLARPLTGALLAILMATLLAVSRWHLTFSRMAFEPILDPFATVLFLAFLLAALRAGRVRDWSLAGVALAFGLNGYLAFRAAALAAVAFLVIELVRRRRREDGVGVALLLGGFFVAIAPLAVYGIQNPEAFTRRTRLLSVWNEVREAGGSLRPLFDNFLKTLGSLHIRGDADPMNNLPDAPLLDPVTGALVLLGLVWALLFFRNPVARLVLLWTVAVGSVDVLSKTDEAPSARRILGLLPILLLAAGMALRELNRRFPLGARRALAVALVGGLVFAAFFNLDRYFDRQAKHPAVWRTFSVDGSAPVGELLRSLPASTAFYYSSTYSIDYVVDFISGCRPYAPLNIAATFPPSSDSVYVLPDGEMAAQLAGLCPGGGQAETHRDPWGEAVFFSFRADARARASCSPALLQNGLLGRYYHGGDATGPVAAVQRDPLIYANDMLLAPFSVVWRGALAVPVDGPYRFRTMADDGALLFIDGALVVDNGGNHAEESREAQVVLKRGFHPVELRYWQRGGARRLNLFWQPPDRPELPISPRFLLPVEGPVPPERPLPTLGEP
jgi:PA14 domain/Dolichyl-phosphate-mannose-protein mannosyltransferase